MSSKTRYELWVGLLLAGALGLLAWMAIKVGAVGGMGPQIHVQVKMHDAAGITPGASVQTFGVEVGRVDEMSLGSDAAFAHLSLNTAANLPANVVARIRSRSVLGEKYLELTPQEGATDPLADGAMLVIGADQIEIDEIVQKGGTLIDKIDVDALAQALSIVSNTLKDDPERMARAFERLDTILENGALASAKLVPLVDHADATLGRADDLMASLKQRSEEARGPIERADSLLAKLDTTLNDVPVAIAELRSTMKNADTMIDTIDDTVKQYADLDDKARELMAGFEGFDKWEVRRLLREEGILIRLKPDQVLESDHRTEDVVPKSGRHTTPGD